MKPELLEQVKALDPTPAESELPGGAWSAALVLQEIDRRSGATTAAAPGAETDTQPARSERTQRRGDRRTLRQPSPVRLRPRWQAGLALGLLVIVIGTVLAVLANSSTDDDVVTSTTQAPVVTTAAPAPDAAIGTVTISDLSGLWFVPETGGFVRNAPDGTFRAANDRLGLESNPIFDGTYRLAGDVLTLISGSAGSLCEEGDVGRYAIAAIDSRGHQMTLIDDECAERGAVRVTTYRRPAPRPADLEGLWYALESEAYVRRTAGGEYVGAEDLTGLDSAPLLVGTTQLDGDILTVVAGAGSYCEEGATGRYQVEILDLDRHRMTLIEDECVFRASWRSITYVRP